MIIRLIGQHKTSYIWLQVRSAGRREKWKEKSQIDRNIACYSDLTGRARMRRVKRSH